jgi:hypothetical protein
MRKLFLLCALVTVAIGYASYRHLQPRPRSIETFIDGIWNEGEYRGCILIPPDRQQLYCGVQAKGSWPTVLSNKDHIRSTIVAFSGKSDVLFWRCKKTTENLQCKDARVKTEVR